MEISGGLPFRSWTDIHACHRRPTAELKQEKQTLKMKVNSCWTKCMDCVKITFHWLLPGQLNQKEKEKRKRKNKKKEKDHPNWKVRSKWQMTILNTDNSKEFTLKKLLELISKFSKNAEHENSIHKSILFIYHSIQRPKMKLRKIPFTTVFKRIKYLERNIMYLILQGTKHPW